MNRVELKRSPWKAEGLLLGGLALVAASVVTARTADEIEIRGIGWVGAAFFSLAVLKEELSRRSGRDMLPR